MLSRLKGCWKETQPWVRKGSLFLALFLLVYVNFIVCYIFDVLEAQSYKGPLFDGAAIQKLNKREGALLTECSYRNHSLSDRKVLFVVLDGLRYDSLVNNVNFSSLMSSSWFRQDAKMWKMTNSVPTMSFPNWVTLLTGAPPELSGLLGNPPHSTPISSLFWSSHQCHLRRGFAGPYQYDVIFGSQTDPLFGHGGIRPFDVQDDPDDDFDSLVAKFTLKALRSVPSYRFFVSHFDQIDVTGHETGVDGRYDNEITKKVQSIRDYLQVLDEKTAMVIVSDHGHVKQGGHKGVLPELREVPLLIYRKGSRLGELNSATGSEQQICNVDVAPTVAALLGAPVPGQSVGVFVKEVVEAWLTIGEKVFMYRDLLQQKIDLTQEFLKYLGKEADPEFQRLIDIDDETEADCQTIGVNQAECVVIYQNLTDEVLDIYFRARDQAFEIEVARNIFVTVILCVVAMLILSLIMQYCSLCCFWSVVYSLCYFGMQKVYVRCIATRLCRPNIDSRFAVISLLMLISTFGLVLIYYLVSFWAVFGVMELRKGVWDSSVMDPDTVKWMIAASICITIVLVRVFQIILWRVCKSSRRFLGVLIFGPADSKDTLVHHYLFIHYFPFILMFFVTAISGMAGTYGFVIPPFFRIRYLSSYLWDLRFEISVFKLISLWPMGMAVLELFIFVITTGNDALHGEFYTHENLSTDITSPAEQQAVLNINTNNDEEEEDQQL
jgi:hypothetical protein